MKSVFCLLLLSFLGTAVAGPFPPIYAPPTPAPTSIPSCRKIFSYVCTAPNQATYFFTNKKVTCATLATQTSYDLLCRFVNTNQCVCQRAGAPPTCVLDPNGSGHTRHERPVSANAAGTCLNSLAPDPSKPFQFVCNTPVTPAQCIPVRRMLEEDTTGEPIVIPDIGVDEKEEEEEEGAIAPADEVVDMSWLVDNAIIGQGNSARAFVDSCGDYDYDGMLQLVEGHFFAVGVARQEAVAAGCPSGVATHAVIEDSDPHVAPQKEFFLWQAHHSVPSQLTQGALPIGSFPLDKLAHAYEEATVSKQQSGSLYEVVSNNCGSFMISMARALGVKVDASVTAFVTRRLMEQKGTELADKIRKSMHYFSLFDNDRQLRGGEEAGEDTNLSDQAVVELLVEKQAAEL